MWIMQEIWRHALNRYLVTASFQRGGVTWGQFCQKVFLIWLEVLDFFERAAGGNTAVKVLDDGLFYAPISEMSSSIMLRHCSASSARSGSDTNRENLML